MAKKYSDTSKKTVSSVKEQATLRGKGSAPRFATEEAVDEAIAHVMKIHGEALQKLAK